VGTKRYREWAPRQAFLLPPSPTEWLPEGHLANFLLDLVDRLNLGPIEEVIARKDPRGERPYAPRMLVALLMYGYCTGHFSSRKLARATYEDVAFRVLAAGEHPHFTTINQFRLDHREAFGDLFVQVLRLCQRAGLVKLGHVSLDGTKVGANASKHKAMSYGRMQEEEVRLRAEINELLANADATDGAEDGQYGVGVAPEDLPEELQRRENRLARIERAMAELQEEAAKVRADELRVNAESLRERATDPSVDETVRRRLTTRASKNEARAQDLDPKDNDDGDDDSPSAPSSELPRHRVRHTPDGNPDPKAQRNFTDPDSRIMLSHGAYDQTYNAQIVVDDQAQIIVACAVTNQPADPEHLAPMLDVVEGNLGRSPQKLSADSGYYSDANVAYCAQKTVDAYIAAGRTRHADGQSKGRMSRMQIDMQAKVGGPEGRALYSRRKVIVEPAIGQIKSGQGFRRFSLRGLAKVRSEWLWVCLTHNLLKLFRATVVVPA
jgi:transposase